MKDRMQTATRASRTSAIPGAEREGMILSKAVIRAAGFLGLSNKVVARTIGLSEALAQLFVRLFRSLDSIVGSDDDTLKSWMRTPNTALGDRPLDLIQTVPGLVEALRYVDSRRAPL
jgi:hypothetical protein